MTIIQEEQLSGFFAHREIGAAFYIVIHDPSWIRVMSPCKKYSPRLVPEIWDLQSQQSRMFSSVIHFHQSFIFIGNAQCIPGLPGDLGLTEPTIENFHHI